MVLTLTLRCPATSVKLILRLVRRSRNVGAIPVMMRSTSSAISTSILRILQDTLQYMQVRLKMNK